MEKTKLHNKSAILSFWLIIISTILLIVVIVLGTVFSVTNNNQPEIKEERYDVIAEDGQTINISKTMAFTSKSLFEAKTSGQDGVHVTLTAYVYPNNAENQNVEWEIKWSDNAPLKDSPVSDYLTGRTDSNNNHLLYLTCKQQFLNNKIIVKVTTVEGRYSATCVVSFIGTAESISIVGEGIPIATTEKRGQYYALGKNTSYSFRIDANNSWGIVGATDYEATIKGHGQVYFAKSYPNEMSTEYWDTRLVNINDFVSKFANISLNGNVLTVTMGGTFIEDYYEPIHYADSSDPQEYFPNTFYKNGVFDWDTFETDYDALARENFERLESVYFSVTVKDKISGATADIRFFFRVNVEGVSIEQSSVQIN